MAARHARVEELIAVPNHPSVSIAHCTVVDWLRHEHGNHSSKGHGSSLRKASVELRAKDDTSAAKIALFGEEIRLHLLLNLQ